MPVSATSGARYLLRGLRLIAQPGLRRFVLVPLLINVLVFSAAVWYGVVSFETFIAWMQSKVPAWLQWLEWVLWPLFVLALLIVVFYTFTLVANLLAAPFNGLLAEKVELHLTGRPLNEGGGLKKVLIELAPTLIDELRKLLYILLWAVPFLLLFLIPGVNVAAPLLWFLYTAWMLAFEYSDYPMGNHGLRLRAIRGRLRRRRALALGFGATAAGMTMIPVLNFVVMPSAVAGATAMWVEALAGDDE
ncbi:MAG: sulfate transporter CysZ [Chromatiaceae bacterium]|jgi:CysZ protein|nr:sulfate transporter CysZ [Chromatiaceae bacterium]